MPMARAQARSCGSCAYWEPYPGWEGVGTCDQELSESYGRMAVGAVDVCDQYALSSATPPERPRSPPRGSTCSECHFWFPLELAPRMGRCDNHDSSHFGEPEFADKLVESCFVVRSLEGVEFAWCQNHRQTIHSSELPAHGGCRVFVNVASLPVEDEMELTLAGD